MRGGAFLHEALAGAVRQRPVAPALAAFAHLEPNGAHWVEIEIGDVAPLVLDRQAARDLLDVLTLTASRRVVVILKAFRPELSHLTAETIDWLEQRLEDFADEVSFEDGRPSERLTKARKALA